MERVEGTELIRFYEGYRTLFQSYVHAAIQDVRGYTGSASPISSRR